VKIYRVRFWKIVTCWNRTSSPLLLPFYFYFIHGLEPKYTFSSRVAFRTNSSRSARLIRFTRLFVLTLLPLTFKVSYHNPFFHFTILGCNTLPIFQIVYLYTRTVKHYSQYDCLYGSHDYCLFICLLELLATCLLLLERNAYTYAGYTIYACPAVVSGNNKHTV